MNVILKREPLGDLDREIRREQSSSLGRAGKKLHDSIKEYKRKLPDSRKSEINKNLLHDIAENFYKLLVQRELTGFINGNIYWIRKYYEIPAEANKYLGVYRERT